MYLYLTSKVLFLFFIELKTVYSTQEIILENDITKALDKWFTSIFSIDSNEVNKLPNGITQYYYDNYTYNSSNALSCFKSMNLRYISFGEPDKYAFSLGNSSSSAETSSQAQFYFKFSANELQLIYEKMIFKMNGELRLEYHNNTSRDFSFNTDISMRNVSFYSLFASSSSSNQSNHTEISYNISYSKIVTKFKSKTGSPNPLLPDEEHDELRREIPLILLKRLNNNQNFLQSLRKIFQSIVNPRNELLSLHPDCSSSPDKFHYLITTKGPFFNFTFESIAITGLSNLDTFKIETTSDTLTRTLIVNNIEGSMTLDFVFQNETVEPSLKMRFKMDQLYVNERKINDIRPMVSVHANHWQVNRTDANITLNARQSEFIKKGFESAIASSIFPTWIFVADNLIDE